MCNAKLQNWWMSEKLKKLNLPLLVYRRVRGDVKAIFKHFHCCNNCTYLKTSDLETVLVEKHDYQLEWKTPKDDTRGLQVRGLKVWNEVPEEIVHAKSSLSTHLKTNWMKRGNICQ